MSEKETALLLEQQEPCADNLLEQAAPQTKDRTESIAQPVKKINSLVTLRLVKNLPVRDMVEVVRVLYPKYDKIIQSKCEHGDEYGVQIRPDAFQALGLDVLDVAANDGADALVQGLLKVLDAARPAGGDDDAFHLPVSPFAASRSASISFLRV